MTTASKKAAKPALKTKNALQTAGLLPSLDDLRRERHRRSYYEFFKDFWSEMEPAEPYVDSRHIKALCDHAQAVVEGRISMLGVEIGPGYAKSMVMAVGLAAWIWGPHGRPGYRLAYSTYAAPLTVRDSNKARDLILSDRYQALYGHGFQLVRKNDVRLTTTAKGERLATSVEGGATGYRVHLWVYDDLLNAKERKSQAAKNAVYEHLSATSSRGVRQSEYARICIGQRLGEDDAGAWFRERTADILCLPTEYDPARHCSTSIGFTDWRTERGEFLFAARFGPNEKLRAVQDMLPESYSAQHQQLAVPDGGGVIKRDYIPVIDISEEPPISHYLVSVDTAQGQDKSNDTTAMSVHGVHQTGMALAGGWSGREPAPKVIQRLKDLGHKFNPAAFIIEQKDWGKALTQLLEGDPGFHWRIVKYTPVVSKDMRADEASPFFYARRFSVRKGDAFGEQAVGQLSVFPRGKVRDLADACIQAAIYAQATYTFESRLTAEMVAYQGGKRASAKTGALYLRNDDDEEDEKWQKLS